MTGAANLSLFGERRLIELRLGTDRYDGRPLADQLAERPPADTLLLVSGGGSSVNRCRRPGCRPSSKRRRSSSRGRSRRAPALDLGAAGRAGRDARCACIAVTRRACRGQPARGAAGDRTDCARLARRIAGRGDRRFAGHGQCALRRVRARDRRVRRRSRAGASHPGGTPRGRSRRCCSGRCYPTCGPSRASRCGSRAHVQSTRPCARSGCGRAASRRCAWRFRACRGRRSTR